MDRTQPGTNDPTVREASRRALKLDDDALLAECELSAFVAGGPGGQHRNRTESGVRLRHPATGVTVSATERRSQHDNRAVALERLRVRLKALSFVPRQRRATKPTRGSQERRLTAKKKAGETKRLRRSRGDD